METITVTIPHRLGQEEAVRRLKPALGQASTSFPVLQVEREVWAGNRMEFGVRALGQVVDGEIEVLDQSIKAQVRLPWMLARFAKLIERTMADRGRILIGKS